MRSCQTKNMEVPSNKKRGHLLFLPHLLQHKSKNVTNNRLLFTGEGLSCDSLEWEFMRSRNRFCRAVYPYMFKWSGDFSVDLPDFRSVYIIKPKMKWMTQRKNEEKKKNTIPMWNYICENISLNNVRQHKLTDVRQNLVTCV